MRGWSAAALAVCAGLACAQPSDAPGRDRGERPAPREAQPLRGPEVAPPVDPAVLRERLERRLAESERTTARLRAALAELDEGADPREVMLEFSRDAMDQARDLRERRGGEDRGRRPGEGFGPWRGQAERLTPEQRERVMGFLRERAPRLSERIERVSEARPEMGEMILARLAPRLREAMGALERDPALGEARLGEFVAGMEVAEAVRAYRVAARQDPSSPETAEAAQAVRAAVDRGFEARLLIAEREIEALDAQIAQLREDLAARRSQRDAEVAAKADELMERALDDNARKGDDD